MLAARELKALADELVSINAYRIAKSIPHEVAPQQSSATLRLYAARYVFLHTFLSCNLTY